MLGLTRASATLGRGAVAAACSNGSDARLFVCGANKAIAGRQQLSPDGRWSGTRSGSSAPSGLEMHGTTILCVRKGGKVVMMGDGQVSQGSMLVKPNAVKVRKLGKGNVIAGFAGSTADALTLVERLEMKLEEADGELQNACVSLAKDWRTDKYLRRLEAVVLVADGKMSLTVSGLGDVLSPHSGVIAVGSGQPYALAAARALMDQEELSAQEVARRSMEIAAELCVYTNNNFTMHELDVIVEEKDEALIAAQAAAAAKKEAQELEGKKSPEDTEAKKD